MKRRLPPDAFEFYFGLGLDRSYQAVADHFGVEKGTVTRAAKRDRWQERVRGLENKAREDFEKKALDEMAAVRERQLRATRLLQHKALELLGSGSPDKAVRAAAALGIAWRHELLLLGEPTDRAAVDVAEVVRRESERWLIRDDGKERAGGDEGAD